MIVIHSGPYFQGFYRMASLEECANSIPINDNNSASISNDSMTVTCNEPTSEDRDVIVNNESVILFEDSSVCSLDTTTDETNTKMDDISYLMEKKLQVSPENKVREPPTLLNNTNANMKKISAQNVETVNDIPYNETLIEVMNATSDIVPEPGVPHETTPPQFDQFINEILDITTLHKYANSIYVEVKKSKNENRMVSTQVINLNNQVTSLEECFREFRSSISGRVLGNELSMEKVIQAKISKIDNIHQKIDTNTNKIGKITNFDYVRKRLDEDIAKTNGKIVANEVMLNKIAHDLKEINAYITTVNSGDSFRNPTP